MPFPGGKIREVKPPFPFPPFRTHVHRGAAPDAGVKYIAATWTRFA